MGLLLSTPFWFIFDGMKDLRTDPQFKLRLPQALKDRLDESAAANSRSINAEITHRLTRSFAPQDAGLKSDGLDVAAFLAMSMMVLLDDSASPELKQAAKARAEEIARPMLEKMVFSKTGPSTAEPR